MSIYYSQKKRVKTFLESTNIPLENVILTF